MKKIVSLLLIGIMTLSLVACGSHPKEYVGKYHSGNYTYGVVMTLRADGTFIEHHFSTNNSGKWWVSNNIIYFDYESDNLKIRNEDKYDLKIASEDIEHEIEEECKDYSPNEKSQLRLNFKFRFEGVAMYKYE